MDVLLEALHCSITIRRPAARTLVLEIRGRDIGELGDRPQRALDELIEGLDRFELFIDARHARGPSVDVGALWAHWLHKRRDRLERVEMLTSSPMVQITADFVQRFSELEGVMRVHNDPARFDAELARASSPASWPGSSW